MRHDFTNLHFLGRFDLPEYDRRLLMMHPAVLLTLFKRVLKTILCVLSCIVRNAFYKITELPLALSLIDRCV